MAFQVIPLFLLPYFVLAVDRVTPGVFDHGAQEDRRRQPVPRRTTWWRAFGFILAWPLFVWNFFNWKPLSWWLVIGCVQTFVLIPLIVRRWGKGAYCGWICSLRRARRDAWATRSARRCRTARCWNRLNMVGQAILAFALRCCSPRASSTWTWPQSGSRQRLATFYDTAVLQPLGLRLLSRGRHVPRRHRRRRASTSGSRAASGAASPARSPRSCTSTRASRASASSPRRRSASRCNVCTSVCHQGIDVMSFANKGLPMEDPECVRCSACVQSCPTGTLQLRPLRRRRRAHLRHARRLAGADGRRRRRQDAPARDGVALALRYDCIVLILYVKALHVIFMVTWFAGLFYLPRAVRAITR